MKGYIECSEEQNILEHTMKEKPPRKIMIVDDAIEGEYGWICSCGRWTKEVTKDYDNTKTHKVKLWK